jgi:hypothetical protein
MAKTSVGNKGVCYQASDHCEHLELSPGEELWETVEHTSESLN